MLICPPKLPFSKRIVFILPLAEYIAAANPEGPPPIIIQSYKLLIK